MGEWPNGMVLDCLSTWCGFESRLSRPLTPVRGSSSVGRVDALHA